MLSKNRSEGHTPEYAAFLHLAGYPSEMGQYSLVSCYFGGTNVLAGVRSRRCFGRDAKHQMYATSVATDSCTHDNVCLDADTSEHHILCNQCGRWWQCYGDVRDVWKDFTRYWTTVTATQQR
jgi:hypothetical protein